MWTALIQSTVSGFEVEIILQYLKYRNFMLEMGGEVNNCYNSRITGLIIIQRWSDFYNNISKGDFFGQ